MRNGGVGEQTLQVVLEHRRVAADQQCGNACAAHQPEPFVRARHHRPETGQQEHAQLHHGGGVQVGRHGRRRSHGIGQPELERELRALGERAEQHQHQRRQIHRVVAHQLGRAQYMVEVVAADDVPNDQHAGQQTQAARAGYGERHAGTAARILAVVPIANQQKREQAGQFPEEHQLNDVAREHHAGHGPHEGQKEREETRHRIGGRHVVARVQHHQGPDAHDQHAEHPGEAVHADHEIQTERREPRELLPNDLTVRDLREVHPRLNQTKERDEACQRRLRIAGVGRQNGSHKAADQRKEDQ